MNSALLKKIQEEVRYFSKQLSWKKFLTFFVFCLVATILWFMQIYNKTFETSIKIPISYNSIPDSIIILKSLPNEIEIFIKDDGFSMFKYALFSRDTLNIDIALLLNGDTKSRVLLQGSVLEQLIRNSISKNSQLISYQPSLINVVYAPLFQKRLPVIFDGNINLAQGYMLSNDIKVIPDSVSVYGAEKDLNKLLYIYTEKDTINGVGSNKTVPIKIAQIPNVKIKPSRIRLAISAEPYVQRSIEIPVSCLNLPDDITVKFFPSKVDLQFYTGISKIDSIKPSDFDVSVDYNSLKDLSTQSIPVRVISTPEYAKSLMINPTNVEFIFEYKK